MKRLVITLMLCFVLLTRSVCVVYATTPEIYIEVAGGSLAAGGLIGESILALGPYAIAILGAGLIAQGINVSLTAQAQAAGMKKTDFIKTQFREWCEACAMTVSEGYQRLLGGTTVGKDGTIYLDQTAAKTISQFSEWAWDADKVADIAGATGGTHVTFGDLQCPVVQTCEYETSSFGQCTLTTDQPVALVLDASNNLWIFNRVRSTNYQVRSGTGNTMRSYFQESVNGYSYNLRQYLYNPTIGGVIGLDVPTLPPSVGLQEWLRGLDGTFEQSPDVIDRDTLTGDKDKYDRNKDLLLPGAGIGIPGIGTGILDGLRNPGIDVPDNGVIPLDGYMDGVKDLIDDLPVSVPVEDTVTGVRDWPVIEDIPAEEVITLDDYPPAPDDPDLPDVPTTPVIDVDVPYVATPGMVEGLTIDLKGVFPFCLPWDCYDMLRKLSASPAAPSYHVHYVFPITDAVFDYTFSLAAFDEVAAVLRKMELFAFCVGLAIATRSIFIRS